LHENLVRELQDRSKDYSNRENMKKVLSEIIYKKEIIEFANRKETQNRFGFK